MSSVVLYSKPNCTYCDQAKILLNNKNISFNEVVIGRDVVREDFTAMFPNVNTVPYILVNGTGLGGFRELTEWTKNVNTTYLAG